jgi:SAM-dependent methyltransferase
MTPTLPKVSPPSEFQYVGSELALFEKARNWKAYWRSAIAPFVDGDVLEAGAGIGANMLQLRGLPHSRLIALEPDASLAEKIVDADEVLTGTLADVPKGRWFDTILYIDVLEHIEDDRGELRRAALHLKPGGRIVVLAPAHPFLYTAFDAAIGHFRRYTRDALRATAPPELSLKKLVYLDSVGVLASLGNRLLLRSSMPTESQILAWDRFLVPLSRAIDPLLAGRAGKSVLGVWSLGQ